MSSIENSTGCKMSLLLSLLSKKWMLLILKSISDGAQTYTEIEKKVGGITPGILSTRLKELQEIGFIDKNIVSTTPLKIEYKLTEKGNSFSEHIKNMCEWSNIWMN